MTIASAKAAGAILAVGVLIANVGLANAQISARGFYGELITRDLNRPGEASSVELMENFGYVDPNGRRWEAPKGIVVNGASIPKPFWSIIGGPWSGPYKRASVIHDHFCETKSRDWKSVHRVFYYAMLDGGVDVATAKIMYFAVYRFGPRWTDTEKNFMTCVGRFVPSRPLSVDEYLKLSEPAVCDGDAFHSRMVYWTPPTESSHERLLARKSEFEGLTLGQIEKIADGEVLQTLPAEKQGSFIDKRVDRRALRSLGLID